MLTLNPNDIPTAQLHTYLLSAVAPRPIAFASTISVDGKPNLSPFSFFNVFSAKPPILVFSPARRVRDNTPKHTLKNVKATKQVVINVVNHAIVQQMSLSSTEYPEGINEFEKAGLTMLASEVVKPFRVAESPIQLECKVDKIIPLGEKAGAGNLVICQLLRLHIDESVLNIEKKIDQTKLDLVARAGGSYYSRTRDGFFEIPKPLRTMGIGVDTIPTEIRNSKVLTGNDLGVLGNVESLPSKAEISTFIASEKLDALLQVGKTSEIHQKAKNYLQQNNPAKAWKLLLAKHN